MSVNVSEWECKNVCILDGELIRCRGWYAVSELDGTPKAMELEALVDEHDTIGGQCRI